MVIRDKDREELMRIADEVLKAPLQIWAYGSRVNGTAHDTSDLDLVIRTDNLQPINSDELNNFKEAITKSNIAILIQVLDWGIIPESFHRNILKNYRVVYDNQKNSK